MDGHPGDGLLSVRSDAPVRGLGPAQAGSVGTFSDAQNRAILVVAVTAASISLAVAVVSLRWFLSMKRSFRHHLILMLICSDTFKALWYFLSPVVIFTRGRFGSSSAFVQATGFLLALGVEAADLSILFIALHSTLYILRPPQRLGHGGLYKYRHWVYASWLLLPLLAASLAFTNRSEPAYVTLGTVAYLPKRPFWYRLALAWIPRYIIFISIISMYTAIYIYVKVKFQGFDNFGSDGLSYKTSSTGASKIGQTSHFTSSASPQINSIGNLENSANYGREPPAFPTYSSPDDVANVQQHLQATDNVPEWEKIDFITRSPLVNPKRISQLSMGIEAADFAHGSTTKPNDSRGRLSPYGLDTRNDSAALTVKTNSTDRTTLTAGIVDSSHGATRSSPALERTGVTDEMAVTRNAIRRQLRFLFIYPVIYLLLWILPFAQHCLNYTNYYTEHPTFWLNVCTTCILALQAGIDCAIFSWRERPWKRMNGSPFITIWPFRKLRARFSTKDGQRSQSHGNSNMDPADPEAVKPNEPKRDSNWWEEEGKKRKDSVWLGTDTVNDIVRTQTMESRKASCLVE
ncbi:hypothetical protein GJ744_011226 [Endocarpon pusillum]|uniref:G protein-coupled receptor GPR1 C-terminal domain-containing protein n=1 Tax=Endocarpon pusillum TaxID=364733 RepID=A0A8H7AXK0_9EURO|nr:hypothetical protein GJ744_011226 [Endocarpon pusillum]